LRIEFRFTCQTAGEQNSQSSAAPVFARRGVRRDFHPLGSRGECSLTKCEGSGAPKGAGNISNALRRTPNDVGRSPRGAPLRRFSLDLETAFCERTGAPDRRNALDSAGFHPRSSALTSPLPDGPT